MIPSTDVPPNRVSNRPLRGARPLLPILGVSLVLLLRSTALAGPGDVVSVLRPALEMRADEQVGASAVDPQGRRLLAINRTVLPTVIRSSRVVRLRTTGELDTTFSAPALDDHVRVLLPAGPDALYVGGSFLRVGEEALAGVVRLRGDGTLDGTFRPAAPFGLRYIYALALDAAGGVLAGGWFNQWEGRPVAEFVKLRSDGAMDLAFMTQAPAPDPFSRVSVSELRVLSDGRVVIRSAGLTVLTPEGTRSLQLGSGGALMAWAAMPDGSWVLVEQLPTGGAPYRIRLRRLNASGDEDLAWRRDYASDGSATGLVRASDGGFWLAGVFSSFAGQRQDGVVRLREDGTLDSGWVARVLPPGGPADGLWAIWGLSARFETVRELDGGTVELTGFLPDAASNWGWQAVQVDGGRGVNGPPVILSGPTQAQVKEGDPVRLGFAVQSSMPFTSLWTRGGVAVSRGRGPILEFREAGLADAGLYQLVVSNALGMATSATVSLDVAWGDTAPGSRDSGFRAVAMSADPDRARPTARLTALETSGAQVYVASEAVWALEPAVTPPVAHVSPQLTRLLPGGAADPAFVMLRGSADAARLKSVRRVLPLRDGRVVVEMELAAVAPEILDEPRLGAVRADGTLDAGFVAEFTRKTPFTRVSALAETAEGGVLVGGLFEGDQPTNSWAVLKLRADGRRDTGFQPVVGTASAAAMALQSGGRLVVELEGVGVRRYLPDGTPDPSFRAEPEPAAGVRLLGVDGADRVVVSVALGDPAQIEPERLVRLKPDGALDTGFARFERRGGGVSVGIHRVAFQTDGRLVVVLNGSLGSGAPVIRLNEDGTVDESFSMIRDTGSVDVLTLTPEGGILVGGTQFAVGTGFGSVLIRLNAADERRVELGRIGGGVMEGRVATRAGRRYEIEHAPAVGASWVPVVAWDGDGRVRSFPVGGAGQGFYRVRLSVP